MNFFLLTWKPAILGKKEFYDNQIKVEGVIRKKLKLSDQIENTLKVEGLWAKITRMSIPRKPLVKPHYCKLKEENNCIREHLAKPKCDGTHYCNKKCCFQISTCFTTSSTHQERKPPA